MSDYQIGFDSPWYLGLLALLPLLWIFSYRSLAGLGRIRRFVALTLRSAVLILLILALAEMQLVRISDRLAVIYLLDVSKSISQDQIDLMLKYVNKSIEKQRDARREDLAGAIVFGRDAAIEVPPLDDDQQILKVESFVDREYTNLAGGLKLAQASFPHDAAKRVVVLSDGNENIGDVQEQIRAMVESGIGVDVVPLRTAAEGEVAVEKITIPPDIRQGQPFDLRVVLNNTTPTSHNGGEVKGRLQIIRRAGEHEQNLLEPPNDVVTLLPGKRVFTIRESINNPNFYTYEARFIADNPADDSVPQNNQATTFTHVRGKGQVLLIEDFENKGQHERLVQALGNMNMEVSVRTSRPEELFTDLSHLQPFDTVILANVPREHFSDAQIQMLVRNTQQMGSGLVMLGGPNSFGAGGWTNTPIEEAMPVDFQIKSTKVEAVGALVLMMHASELAQGNHWQKVVAKEAIKTLGQQDYCGLLHWSDQNGTDDWLWGRLAKPKGMLRVGQARRQMLAALDQMTPGDMPQFDPALNMARTAFAQLKVASAKHMIIISDGDPSLNSMANVQALRRIGVKVSTVAIGTHGPAGSRLLQSIAVATGGKYYKCDDPTTLPRIYQTEARRVARPLVYEREAGFQPYLDASHEMVEGISDTLPPITGFVMTTRKDSRLVEVPIISPQPPVRENATILANWTYGLGRAVAFTSDAGNRWATAWGDWEGYDKLFSQVIGWSMRPVGDSGKFTVATDVQDGKVKVVVTALDKDDEFLNLLDIGGTIVGPDMKPITLDIKQTAPGRYVGEFDARDKGSYFIMLNPGPGRTPIRAGVNIAYSDEFRDRESNEPLLRTLADLSAGKVIAAPVDGKPEEKVETMLQTNPYRHDLPKATNSQDIWHWLVFLGSCLFFFDVFTRRVTVSFAWVPPLAVKVRDHILGRERLPAESPVMDRLRSRKAEVTDQIEQRRAAARFEPSPDAPVDGEPAITEMEPTAAAAAPSKPAAPQRSALAPEKDKEQENYTSRLLKAKQKVWEERKKEDS